MKTEKPVPGWGIWKQGQAVLLLTFTPDLTACLVEGETIHGWTAKGRVACNRLGMD